jgi:putative SOS response-associated peptidase YedK
MCYYNGVFVSKEAFIRLKSLEIELKALQKLHRPIQSGFEYSTSLILVPTADKQTFEIEDAHWEFIPPWCSNWQAVYESRKKFTTLNAVGENLFASRLYKDAALKRRCLVLSSGFYEWRHYKPIGAKKALTYPYFINVAQAPAYFFMAGIFQPWTDKETGEIINTFAIVTTKANSLMEQVHNIKKLSSGVAIRPSYATAH